MAQKFLGYDRVLRTSRKGVPAGKIRVWLKRDDNSPTRRQIMSLEEYARRAFLK